MRITVLCTDLGVRVPGAKGASIHLMSITSAFATLGHEVQLVAVSGTAQQPHELIDQLADVRLLPHPGTAEGLQRERNKLAFVEQVVHDLGPHISYFQPDLVYERLSLFGTAGARITAGLTGCRHVVEVNALLAEEESAWRGLHQSALAQRIERRVLNSADLTAAVSDEVSEKIRRVAPGARRAVVPNGVDVARFQNLPDRRQARAALGLPIGTPLACFVGALRPWHGVEVALDAVALLQNLELAIVGDGPVRASLEDHAARLGIAERVHFLGHRDHSDAIRALAASDIALAPYPALEGFSFSPLKLYEYLAAGVPVVASAIGQIPAILDGGRWGTLVRPGDAEDLAAGLGRVLLDRPTARTVALAARAHTLANDGWDKRAQRICDLVTDIDTRESSREVAI